MDKVTNTDRAEPELSLKNKLSLKKEYTGLKGVFILQDTVIVPTGFVGRVGRTDERPRGGQGKTLGVRGHNRFLRSLPCCQLAGTSLVQS
jgi:hypothetical protein